MSGYGKLVLKLEVLDPSITGDEDDVMSKNNRWVTMLTRHCVTHSQAHKMAWAFIESNIPKDRWQDLDVMWYPDPIKIGSWK